MGRIQMNFIHLLSTEAVQHITVHCLNTPVWAAGPSLQPSTRAVSFKAWTGERIQAGDLLEPLVPRDDCWVRTYSLLILRFLLKVKTIRLSIRLIGTPGLSHPLFKQMLK